MGKRKQSSWKQLCEQVRNDDGLPVRESGFWAEKKLFFWNRYIEITTTAMVGSPKWPGGLVYVDLFSGPGICVDRKTEDRFPGSPLIAANAPKPFERILLCELNPLFSDACESRMMTSPAANCFQMFQGDCNVEISSIAQAIPKGSLTLAFLDPTGLHLHFNTVEILTKDHRVDLLILFPDAIDIMRNSDFYFDKPESNLDKVLGTDSNWRERKSKATSTVPREMRQLYAEIYKDQLASRAGYTHFGEEIISGPSGPLYRLVYATNHQKGLDFWNESLKLDKDGQKSLF